MASMTVAAPNRTTVAELRAGGEMDGIFACSRKDRLTAKNGGAYLAVELRDRTGAISGRAFREADFLSSQFERGDLVWVAGRVERFRDELQVEVKTIRRAEDGAADPASFLPVAYRDLDELDGFLEHLAREVYDPAYRALLDAFLADDGFRAELRRAPCSRGGHHAYLGGLLEHTVAVATLAHEACTLHPRLNSDLLLTAALLHDIGKTREFSLGAEISLSEEGALLGHLTIGQQLVAERATRVDGFPRHKLLELSHCILGHHGPDALPGRRFRSAEAIALQRLNSIDAAVKGALEHGLP
jgi:3'-5' exoribonuclease